MTRLAAGECSAADVAELAAEVMANPPPAMRAAQRFAALLGTEHEGMAAVELLRLLADAGA